MKTRLGSTISRTDPHRHKYGSAMAEYLDELAGSGMGTDQESGDADAPTGWFARVGRWMLYNDSQGFVDATRFATEAEAIAAFEELDGQYGAWADADDDEVPYATEYCDLCEREGHTFYDCARRDDA